MMIVGDSFIDINRPFTVKIIITGRAGTALDTITGRLLAKTAIFTGGAINVGMAVITYNR